MFGDANAALRTGGERAATNTVGRERVSMAVSPTTAALNRLPTVRAIASTASSTTSSTESSLMDTTECVDAYTECIKATDVCGADFEECTTHELFYAQKPKCNNVLLQCSTAGINTLFGTTSITNLTADNIEVYPTQGSILGQFIEAGAINNRLDKSSCVKRYTSCLHKENVCGESFELCTSNNEFKKQKIYCESTLARCTDDGKTELFGSTNVDSNPTATSRLGVMIKEGADLASVNAVSTCYKVADQCILSTCKSNPYKCITDSSMNVINITDSIVEGLALTSDQATALAETLTSANVNSFIRGACKDTIGGNKYCHMTVNEGKVPTASQLIDEDVRDEIYSDIYASRMNAVMRGKIKDFANEFDKKTKDKCVETIMSCTMRSCGSGLGSLCYKKVFGTGNNTADFKNSINGANTYAEIENGCAAIVNTDSNCQYAAAVSNTETGGYAYAYNDNSVFGVLFPTAGGNDVLGVVERLNAALAENYNDAAIAKLAKDCRNATVGCIKSMCGTDYVNCYRNRTDIMSDTYDTGNAAFDHSMNKVGGVLDFNIVRGLCVESVKNANSCDEHLKIQSVRYMSDNGADGWGNNNVRTAWNDAVKSGYKQSKTYDEQVLVGCTVDPQSTSENCKAKIGNINMIEDCDYIDDQGCVYNEPYYQTETDYAFTMASDTLFQEVLGDIEKEAQAKYNAKLTAEQHMCIDANNGGLMGRRELSGTYMWVKLKSKRIPKNYSTAGLKVNDFEASNDLYGSFCRARVTIQSDDPDIQSALQQKNQSWSTAYFAVGDVFTCGSWIPQKDLEKVASFVACQKAKAAGTIDRSTNCSDENVYDRIGLTTGQQWATAAVTIGSAGLGVAGMELLQSKTGLGGLLGTSSNAVDECTVAADNEINFWKSVTYTDTCCESTGSLKNTSCPGGTKEEVACKKNYTMSATGVLRKSLNSGIETTYTTKSNAGSVILQSWGIDHIEKMETAKTEICGSMSNGRMWERVGMDVLGAGALGTLGGLATYQNIKASNRQKFTAAQQEFMNNVGNHIYCFIGADEAGTYGDLIEISID